jgi:hypothetical protein
MKVDVRGTHIIGVSGKEKDSPRMFRNAHLSGTVARSKSD